MPTSSASAETCARPSATPPALPHEARVLSTAAPAMSSIPAPAATAEALRAPRAYGNETHVESIETHHSWVFLTDSFAYKLKKPKRTAAFDYTTLEARRQACETELRLNRRLAPSTYLAVVPVSCDAGALRVEGSGAVVDWLVKMRRLPRDWMLDALIRRQAVSVHQVEELSRLLSRFYHAAAHAGLDGADYRQRIEAEVVSKSRSLAHPRYGLELALVRSVSSQLTRWLERQSDLLLARAPLVVEAHGDLRPEHICLEGAPVVIDCLDFDRDLRLLDPVSELAFLALECGRLGSPWIGAQLLASHGRESGDFAPETLSTFYRSYHGLVRAALAVWHLDEPGQPVEAWRARARAYLELADQAP